MDKEILLQELELLNLEVKRIIAKRSKFLDDNMHYFAPFQIGEKVYNCSTGEVGVVTKHYRYHAKSYEYDTSLHCNCRVNCPIGSNFVDNTSVYGSLHPYIKITDYENKTDTYIQKLKLLARFSR